MTAGASPAGGGPSSRLTLALPRGRPWAALGPLLAAAGVPGAAGADPERRLVSEAEGARLLFTRPADVVTYVREGVADAGVTGSDVLWEDGGALVELLDLPLGSWRLSVAVPADGPPWPRLLADRGDALRVATSYPRATSAFFAGRGLAPHVVRLRGAVELAAAVGLADCIVDMVETGRTLGEHGLVESEVIGRVTLRLVAGQASYRWRAQELGGLQARLRAALEARGGP